MYRYTYTFILLNMQETCESLPISALPDLVAGVVLGLTAENHLEELTACINGGELIVYEIRQGVKDLKAGGIENYLLAIFEFVLIYKQFGDALSDCEHMQDDLRAIEEWGKIFTDLKHLSEKVTYNYMRHKKEFTKDAIAIKADWDAENFFKAGVDISTLLNIAIGPIQESYLLVKFGIDEEAEAVQTYLAYSQF